MPKKNKTACKRRKCQRSRRLSRSHNRRRTRTIRRGGWSWTRKRPHTPTPTPTLINTLLENPNFRDMKRYADRTKMSRESGAKIRREAEERKLEWEEKKKQKELELRRSNATQQRKCTVRNSPTRTPEQGLEYRKQLGSLADQYEAYVASRETRNDGINSN